MIWRPLLIAGAVLFLYSSVLGRLMEQWWSDENYSHGLLVPFVIGFILWSEFDNLKKSATRPEVLLGSVIVFFSALLLLTATLGAELFTQRLSLVILLAGTVVYFFGRRILAKLAVPFALLLLAIPIPQIIFNKISFPLQLLATRAANWGIQLFGIDSARQGNVIELVPRGESKPAFLEVVEACSGIRSLMMLITLGLILRYFTRVRHQVAGNGVRFYKDPEFWRTVTVLLSAVPIALVTNALRVFATGLATYYYGQQVTESAWHDAFGWGSYFIALLLLIGVNSVIVKAGRAPRIRGNDGFTSRLSDLPRAPISNAQVVALFIAMLVVGVMVNWFERRAELQVARQSLSEFPIRLDEYMRFGNDTRFDAPTESILRASDYVMRDYLEVLRDTNRLRIFNLYIGYYASQRTGSTYHSPRNCLPGSGWELSDGGLVEMTGPNGETFTANRYTVRHADESFVMLYWYQGRGRTAASEYVDKLYTIVDSLRSGRSDGSMVRVMTRVEPGETEDDAVNAAKRFSASVVEQLPRFVPQ